MLCIITPQCDLPHCGCNDESTESRLDFESREVLRVADDFVRVLYLRFSLRLVSNLTWSTLGWYHF